MSDISAIDLFDPRGRADRQGLAILAAVLIGGQFGVYGALEAWGVSLEGHLAGVFHTFFLWLTIVAISKRLHDVGVSGWRFAGAAMAMALWIFAQAFTVILTMGEDRIAVGELGFTITLLGSFLPLMAAAVWLHCAKGNPGDNTYGPAPGPSGFSRGYRGQRDNQLNAAKT